MYAIVSIAGQQFKVEKNKKVFVHRLQETEGSLMEFDKVLLIDNEGKVKVGDPYIKNALVTAKIVSHLKGDKVLVFKKKRKKGYQKLNGHRQYLTEILIDDILENATKKAEAPKKEKKEEPVKTEAKVDTPKTKADVTAEETKPKAKKPAAKKSTKPASKKPAPKKPVKAAPKAKTEKKPAAAKKTDSSKKDK